MKTFILKTFLFAILAITILAFLLFFIPDNVSKNNLLGALPYKHQLLTKAGSPKIILVGGSNVSFGLDSKRIHEAFNMPVVNMGIHASIGLRFIVNDITPYLGKGDVVVLMPEYSQYFTDSFDGNIELVSILFDVFPEGRKLISIKQWGKLAIYIPTYAASKLANITPEKHPEDFDVYAINSFNGYGDAYLHWTLPNRVITPAPKNDGSEMVRPEVLDFIKTFYKLVESKDATMVILPPAYQASSFNNQSEIIGKIRNALIKNNLPLLADPGRYKFDDRLCFNSASHLNKEGIDIRTSRVIEDLTKTIEKTQKTK